MKRGVAALFFLLSSTSLLAQFPSQIKNVIVIFQENRSPDNLFQGLTPKCPLPVNGTGLNACIPTKVTSSCYDISPCGVSNQGGTLKKVTLAPVPLAGSADPSHSHFGFEAQCDADPATLKCRNDGAWKTAASGAAYSYVANAAVTNSDGTAGHLLDPYLNLAKQYGWANYMYQTNQGPSYPAHLYIFGGTSAMTAADDANSKFIAENFSEKTLGYGCLAPADAASYLISPVEGTPAKGCTLFADGSVQECPITNSGLIYPTDPVGTFCNQHASMGSLLDAHAISWKYYTPNAGTFWTAPNAIQSICEPAFVTPSGNPSSPLKCTGAEWNANVDVKNFGTDILRDIAACDMSRVNWVVPNGVWSDHAGSNDFYGPSWVAAVINALGTNPKCPAGTKDAGETYWQDTAIVVTWDDWGGWADNAPPPIKSSLPCTSANCKGDYEYGFRVPLLVVSAYTPAGYINNVPHDFGSILRMIEGINHLTEGQLGFADKRATSDLNLFFSLKTPRAYKTIKAQKDASYFLGSQHLAVDPDDD